MKQKHIFFLPTISLLIELSLELQQVKIGAIFFEDEHDLEISFTTSVNRINQQRYSELRLFPIKHYISMDDSIVLQRLACGLIEDGVAAIFGPSSKASNDIVAIICNSTGIPNIAFDWQNERTDREKINHQMTINMAPSAPLVSKAYADIILNYGWKGFTILYESDEALVRLQDLLQSKSIHEDGIKLRKFNRGDDYRILWKNVRYDGERRVILDCPPDILVDVINSSSQFNMTGQFNHFFLTNLDTHQGNLPVLNNIRFKANFTAVRMDLSYHDYLVNSYFTSTLMFDAVQLFAQSVRSILETQRFFEHHATCDNNERNRGRSWRMGQTILHFMKNSSDVNGTFLTKNIQFDQNGERINFNLEIFRPISTQVIAMWSPEGQVVPVTISKEKVYTDYSQAKRHYKVATRIGEPYFMLKVPKENEILVGNQKYEGYSVDLIHKLSEIVDFDYTFETVDDNKYGNYNPETKEWNGIVGYLIDRKADIGICDLTITQARRSVVDFTVPFMQLGISILYYKKKPQEEDLFKFLLPFKFDVWIYILIANLFISLVFIFMSRISNKEWENPHPCNPDPEELENKWGASNTTWLTMGSIMGQGSDILPRAGPMRLANGFWWFFAIIMLNSYTANLAAFLTSSKMESDIEGISDLAEQNKIQFGTVKGGSTSTFFSESNDTIYRMAWSKMVKAQPTVFTKDNNEGVARVKKNMGTYAFLMETTSLEYNTERNCDLQQVGSQIGEKHYGIAVPLGSDYRSNLSVAILKLSEQGGLFELKKKWWKTHNVTCEIPKNVDGNELSIVEVGGVFLVLSCGILVAYILGISEFLLNVQRVAVEERLTPYEAFKTELSFALKFWLKRKPIRTSTTSSTKSSKNDSSRSSSDQSK